MATNEKPSRTKTARQRWDLEDGVLSVWAVDGTAPRGPDGELAQVGDKLEVNLSEFVATFPETVVHGAIALGLVTDLASIATVSPEQRAAELVARYNGWKSGEWRERGDRMSGIKLLIEAVLSVREDQGKPSPQEYIDKLTTTVRTDKAQRAALSELPLVKAKLRDLQGISDLPDVSALLD